MKKYLILLFIILFLIAAIAYELTKDETTVPTDDTPGIDFPNPTTPIEPPTSTSTPPPISNEILQHEDVTEDEFNAGQFFIGYRFPEEGDILPPYVITYIPETQFFNVTLLQESFNESRQLAEAYLQTILNLTSEEMCALSYSVSIPAYVNEYYSGMDLKFSFCPESSTLE